MELQARKQREKALEAALAEKEYVEDDYKKKVEEAKRKEAALENDLANMWVLVAQLKKDGSKRDNNDFKVDNGDIVTKTVLEVPKEEPLVARLKARMQEMKEKEHMRQPNSDINSHVCKVCFESTTTTMLLPCRHFCLCKSCSLACSECPICRTMIADRIFAFT
jgi:centromeric protein E